MAKIEKTQTEVTLSSETKRYLRNLTSALEKVARSLGTPRASEPKEGTKRLSEPAEEPHTITLSPEPVKRIEEATGKQVKM